MSLFRVRGDFGRLGALIHGLARLERQGPPALLVALGRGSLALVEEGFRGQNAPSGAPWAASKKPGAGDLKEQGRLRRSFRVAYGWKRMEVYSTSEYAAVHQHGSRRKRIPARPMLPRRGTIAPAWAKRFRVAAKAAVARFLGGL
jgi:hypothetical protein